MSIQGSFSHKLLLTDTYHGPIVINYDLMTEKLILAGDLSAMTISRMERRGEIHRIARGIYTTAADRERYVAAKLYEVVGRIFPDAVITDRSAVTGGPVDGRLYLSSPFASRSLRLPGISIEARKGAGPVVGDTQLPGGLYLASRARALLDNLRPTRSRGGRPRATLTPDELDDWIDRLCRIEGEERLIHYCDQAQSIYQQLGASAADIERLSHRVSAAVRTRTVSTGSAALQARSRGKPFDADRVDRFDVLAAALRNSPPQHHYRDERDPLRYRYAPFFDAYFSNFVEGTEFAVKEAASIVFDGLIPAQRTADAHDVTGTYQILKALQDDARRPVSGDEFIELLHVRHAVLMGGRPEKNPGSFKTQGNQAGATVFVAPEMVEGTLREGFDRITSLQTPFERAVMMMFVVAEVHPFDDGNGRMARVMMNAELEAGGETRIIIPTVYRDDYLGALRRLSRYDDASPLTKALSYAHDVFSEIDFRDLADAERQLTAVNAFEEGSDRRLLRLSSF